MLVRDSHRLPQASQKGGLSVVKAPCIFRSRSFHLAESRHLASPSQETFPLSCRELHLQLLLFCKVGRAWSPEASLLGSVSLTSVGHASAAWSWHHMLSAHPTAAAPTVGAIENWINILLSPEELCILVVYSRFIQCCTDLVGSFLT